MQGAGGQSPTANLQPTANWPTAVRRKPPVRAAKRLMLLRGGPTRAGRKDGEVANAMQEGFQLARGCMPGDRELPGYSENPRRGPKQGN